jgi:hypothetical protein
MGRMICPMCGLDFDPDDNTRCGGCFLKKKCETICCPRCGYETVVESSLIRIAKRLFCRRAAGA